MQYKCYIFDLDNTLYDENQYLFQAYRAISLHLFDKFNINPDSTFFFMKHIFEKNGREGIFEKLISHYEIEESIYGLLDIFINFKLQDLNLYPWVQPFFNSVEKNKKMLAICTNGRVQQQIRKFDALKLDSKKIYVSYANLIEPKPSPKALIHILNKFNIPKKEAVFIGDHQIDKAAADKSEIDFVYVDKFKKML